MDTLIYDAGRPLRQGYCVATGWVIRGGENIFALFGYHSSSAAVLCQLRLHFSYCISY